MELKNYIKTTPKYINLLAANGIKTIRDFFLYFPRTYEDRKNIVPLSALQSEQIQYTVKIHLTNMAIIKTAKGRKVLTFQAEDEAGTKCSINFFYAPYLVSQIKTGQRYLAVGKPKNDKNKIAFWHPEMILTDAPQDNQTETSEDVMDFLEEQAKQHQASIDGVSNDTTIAAAQHDADRHQFSGHHIEGETTKGELVSLQASNTTTSSGQGDHQINRIYPVYPELQGIKSAWFAKKIRETKQHIPQLFGEYLPKSVLEDCELMDYTTTIQQMHYPDTLENAHEANRRISFDSLLRVQLSSLMQKYEYQKGYVPQQEVIDWDIVKEIIDALPFALTQAQKKCIKAIIENLHDTRPMLRLLQGDVGSGKTVVAAIAAYYVIKKYGGQVAFLAPLEVLAQQHYRSMAKVLLPLGIRLACITGSTPAAEKKKIKDGMVQGHVDVVIGTHALLQDSIDFHKLFFVVIDEQHKFGVRQRAFFKKFGSPHILQMTATPIPRSMALAFFGEFTVSTIDEMPAGRKPITTKIISESEFKKLKQWVLTKLGQNQRLFIVTPLIEESEIMHELKSAMQEYRETCELYTELEGKIGLLHGKLKPAEKQAVMEKFKKGEYMILVSTTVIEVGIDVPEATIMIIKNADRFGLAQLHQLRGRVGRSDIQSYCFLETKYKSGDSYKRLRAMEQYTDGFKLAELDLKYRGAGEFLGTRQSGVTDIPYEMMADTAFLERIQSTAQVLLEQYPGLVGLEALQQSVAYVDGDLLV